MDRQQHLRQPTPSGAVGSPLKPASSLVEQEGRRRCPQGCNAPAELLATLPFSHFDGPAISNGVQLCCCEGCGFLFNNLSLSGEELNRWYQNEGLYAADMGVGSGGLSELDRDRYQVTSKLIEPCLQDSQNRVVDVGCARGGLLRFLHEQGHRALLGVDLNPSCIEGLREAGIPAAPGAATSLPSAAQGANLLIYSNLLEHLLDPMAALREAHRVLADDGVLLIEVPDVDRYGKYPMFELYWLAQQEHINHYSAHHLAAQLYACGFEVTKMAPIEPLIAAGRKTPFLAALARKATKKDSAANFVSRANVLQYKCTAVH